jgi:hypothetical protein
MWIRPYTTEKQDIRGPVRGLPFLPFSIVGKLGL